MKTHRGLHTVVQNGNDFCQQALIAAILYIVLGSGSHVTVALVFPLIRYVWTFTDAILGFLPEFVKTVTYLKTNFARIEVYVHWFAMYCFIIVL